MVTGVSHRTGYAAELGVAILVLVICLGAMRATGGNTIALISTSIATSCVFIAFRNPVLSAIILAPSSTLSILTLDNPLPIVIAGAAIVALTISRSHLIPTLPTIVAIPSAAIIKFPNLDSASSEFFIATSLSLSAAVLIGITVHRINIMKEHSRQAAQELSSTLHDNVTSKLSTAIVLLECLQSSLLEVNSEIESKVPLAKTLIRSAAEEARSINSNTTEGLLRDCPQLYTDIHTLIREEIHTLQNLGFAVKYSIIGPPVRVPTIFRDATREVFVNAHKYAEHEKPIVVTLDTSRGALLAVENHARIPANAPTTVSGQGIARYSAKLHSAGGQMRITSHGPLWKVTLTYPCARLGSVR